MTGGRRGPIVVFQPLFFSTSPRRRPVSPTAVSFVSWPSSAFCISPFHSDDRSFSDFSHPDRPRRFAIMNAKLLFAVSLGLVGLLCCHGKTNVYRVVYLRSRGLFDEPVDTDVYVKTKLYSMLNLYNQMNSRFQKIRENMYPEFVGKKELATNILRRRRRDDNLPSTPLLMPFTHVVTNVQSTIATSVNVSFQLGNTSSIPSTSSAILSVQPSTQGTTNNQSTSVTTNNQSILVTSVATSQPENTSSAVSTISLTAFVPKVHINSSASTDDIDVPENLSTSNASSVQENQSYDTTSAKCVVPENEFTTSSVTPSIKIKQDDLDNDYLRTLQNNTNDVKIDRMVDESTKISTSSDTNKLMFWSLFLLFVIVATGLILGLQKYYTGQTWLASCSNRARYEVRRGVRVKDEATNQI